MTMVTTQMASGGLSGAGSTPRLICESRFAVTTVSRRCHDIKYGFEQGIHRFASLTSAVR
jgi:hypothetical protein